MAGPKKTIINPFHFVPPGKRIGETEISKVVETLQDKPGDRTFEPPVPELLQDRYISGGTTSEAEQYYSGRIICKLTTKSPCVFGNEHTKVPIPGTEDETTRVDNFSINGLAAIAGTSLKGMLSTIAEIASGSAMRVLNNRVFSIRSTMRQSRSAIGMIIEHNGERKLLPLTLPTFSKDRYDQDPDVYKPTYNPTQEENEIWHQVLKARRSIEPGATMTAVYVEKRTNTTHCFRDRSPVVALPGKYPGIAWDTGNASKLHAPASRQNDMVRKGSLLRPVKKGSPNDNRDNFLVEDVDTAKQQTLGIVRKLQQPSPAPKKLWFAMFLPICPQWHAGNGDFHLPGKHADRLLMDAEQACCEFDAIVTDAFSNAPDKPSCTSLVRQNGFQRRKRPSERLANPGLRHGDLVFFKPRGIRSVESVAISSIWREGVRWMWGGDADLLDDGEQRPMNKDRELVSIAEKMFGWVDDVGDKKEESKEKRAKVPAYKGRIRISDALSAAQLADSSPDARDGVQLWNHCSDSQTPDALKDYFALKILASPKPPCPEFYLTDTKTANNDKIRVDFLAKESIKIQGTKYYWIHPETYEKDGIEHWRTKKGGSQGNPDDALKQRCFVRPIRHGVDFWFHVDFENLTSLELQLLCYCLHPSGDFIHRCGFAKPLGLGSVKLTPVSISYVDRLTRYGQTNRLLGGARRYVQTVGAPDELTAAGHAVKEYAALPERSHAVVDPQHMDSAAPWRDVVQWSEAFAGQIPDQHSILQLVGAVPEGSCPVLYPHIRNPEEKIYEWFVANRHNAEGRDHRGKDIGKVNQRLTPLTPDMDLPPSLEIDPWQ